ncbi:SITS-binding protein-like [Convolutriloba macropyga]|uniref:SITS-binding protein-like n=1 Tax=Convolutriloba macropyga TaxID=536237 RepID=UPI003F525D16
MAKLKAAGAVISTDTVSKLPNEFKSKTEIGYPYQVIEKFSTEVLAMLETNNSSSNFTLLTSVPESKTGNACIVLDNLQFTWEGLNSLMPQIQSLAIRGQKCFLPPAIDFSSKSPGVGTELFKRWMQVLVHFETLVMDSKLLSNLNSNQIESLLSLIEYRNKFVVSELKFANSQTSPYDSIIRPLWFDYPDDEKAIMISDEILIGSHFLLAPILEPGVLERDVYLPRGSNWKYCPNGVCTAIVYEGGSTNQIKTGSDDVIILFEVCKYCAVNNL